MTKKLQERLAKALNEEFNIPKNQLLKAIRECMNCEIVITWTTEDINAVWQEKHPGTKGFSTENAREVLKILEKTYDHEVGISPIEVEIAIENYLLDE